MAWGSIILTVIGLSVFEIISSIDNAIINADVLQTMGQKGRKWFLFWGMLFAVFVVRGLLPWLIVWISVPGVGPVAALSAAFNSDHHTESLIEASAPPLLISAGIFLVFLFFRWLFLERKLFGAEGVKAFKSLVVWLLAILSILAIVIHSEITNQNYKLVFGVLVGLAVYFVSSVFKSLAETDEAKLVQKRSTDLHKILYLEIIDATFSVDAVFGAFAFTLSVPLIFLGNGIGSYVVRHFTVSNIERIKKYVFLKNGAMYSLFVLGLVMILNSLGYEIKSWVSPIITLLIVGFFLYRSVMKQPVKA
ncbi:MAG: hypothetical protein JWO40_810 [Candidatus Doudnabacteria bacterium]|nr:hypothetical protein [Candidatus Doudnabacteria bacterium]